MKPQYNEISTMPGIKNKTYAIIAMLLLMMIAVKWVGAEELVPGTGLLARSLDNATTREWYHQQLADIPNRIDQTLSKQEQALQAFKLRNEIKVKARALMRDQKALKALPPPSTLKDIAKTAYDKNLVGDKFWEYMYSGSQRSNKVIDDLLGITPSIKTPGSMP